MLEKALKTSRRIRIRGGGNDTTGEGAITAIARKITSSLAYSHHFIFVVVARNVCEMRAHISFIIGRSKDRNVRVNPTYPSGSGSTSLAQKYRVGANSLSVRIPCDRQQNVVVANTIL